MTNQLRSEGVRAPAKMGSWYDQEPRLSAVLAAHYKSEPQEGVKFVIAPHAGLAYAAESQGAVFSRVNLAEFEAVLILGVCHVFTLRGLGQTRFSAWANPLDGSSIPVSAIEGIKTVEKQKDQAEHSIELLIPYLSYLMQKQGI